MPADVSASGVARLAPSQQAVPAVAAAEQLAASTTFLLSDDEVNVNGPSWPPDREDPEQRHRSSARDEPISRVLAGRDLSMCVRRGT